VDESVSARASPNQTGRPGTNDAFGFGSLSDVQSKNVAATESAWHQANKAPDTAA
jgi:hypothetical protein